MKNNFNIFEELRKQKNEKAYIGDISFTESITEDGLGTISFPKSKDISNKGKVYVYNKEGEYPHCHIVFDDKEDCCIMLDRANYFIHPGKTATLNKSQLKQFVKWCNEKNTNKKINTGDDNSFTNFKAMLFLWNKNNPENKIKASSSIPEYKSDMIGIKSETKENKKK